LVIGDLAWLVIVPAALLIREQPGDVGAAALGGAARAGREYSTGQVVATPQFWAIALTHFACCAAHSGPIFHMVTHATDQVMGAAYGGVFLVSTLGMGLGSFAGGVLYDHLGSYTWLYAGSFAVGTLAVALAFTFRAPRTIPLAVPAR